jgi:hypothetical protein
MTLATINKEQLELQRRQVVSNDESQTYNSNKNNTKSSINQEKKNKNKDNKNNNKNSITAGRERFQGVYGAGLRACAGNRTSTALHDETNSPVARERASREQHTHVQWQPYDHCRAYSTQYGCAGHGVPHSLLCNTLLQRRRLLCALYTYVETLQCQA